jgi:dihydrofolate reductase
MGEHMLYLIAARSENNVIGAGLEIPWQVKGEQRLFREITSGNTLIMGRKTFDSIGRALPNRDTVIVTRQSNASLPDCHRARSLANALDIARELRGDTFIAGGGEIYQQAIDLADGIHLTTIHTVAAGDVFFPEFDAGAFEVVEKRHYESNINYTYEFLLRRTREMTQ